MAPRNDLNLLQEIESYKSINIDASQAAKKSFSNHLWYLSDNLVGFAFFDRELSNETKSAMVKKLQFQSNTKVNSKKANISSISDISQINLDHFVSNNTENFFEILFGKVPEFLNKDPDTWILDPEYLMMETEIKHILIVNDVAERGVKLITDYNTILCNDEEQKQFILQIVENHRKRFPIITKANLCNNQN